MQSKRSLGVFRFLAGFVSIYHFGLGLIGIFASSETVVWFVNKVYGINPTVDAQFIYLSKFIAAYMIVFAIATLILALKPIEYRKLVWVPITLFSIRVIQRIVFFDLLQSAFKIDWARNLQVIVPIAILAIALFYLRPRGSLQA